MTQVATVPTAAARAPRVPAVAKRTCPLSTREVMDRILLFMQEFMGYKLYTYQLLFARRIVESVLGSTGDTITGLWSRQSGKTETVACVVISMAIILPALAKEFPDDPRFMPYQRGFLVGVYAPIADQAALPFGRMRDRVHSERGQMFLSDREINVGIVQSRGDFLSFSNGSKIRCKSASPDTNIEGATHHLVIIEEAQKVLRSKVEKDIVPMLASTNGTMVKIGTAWVTHGGFHSSIQQNVDQYENGGKRNHFEFPYDMVVAEKRRMYDYEVKDHGVGNPFHLNYEAFVEKEIVRLGGTESEEFKMNFRCLWQESKIVAINERIFAEAGLSMERGQSPLGFQVAGLDIGKTIDTTVLTVMEVDYAHPIVTKDQLPGAEDQSFYRKIILDWFELHGSFEGDSGQYAALVNYLRGTRVQVMAIDATSVGDPVYERIEAILGDSIVCIPFKFSLATKSNLYKYYLQELHARRIFYAAGEETRQSSEYQRFQSQHIDLDKFQHGSYIVAQAPEGGHDDYPDSAALACWAEKQAESVKMVSVEVSFPSGPGNKYRGRQVSSGQGGEWKALTGARAGRYSRRW